MKQAQLIEMSIDGGPWEIVHLPTNCLPFHQTQLLGKYHEGDPFKDVLYRIKEG